MLGIAGLLASEFLLEQSAWSAVLWFAAGIGVGFVAAIASLGACALGCLGHTQVSRQRKVLAMRATTGVVILGFGLSAAFALAGCEPRSRRADGESDRLATAGFPGPVTATDTIGQDSSPMVVRRVWYSPDNLEFWGGPSPDGCCMTYVGRCTTSRPARTVT
jgi:hypothetical protein